MDQTNALNAPQVPTGTSPATEVHHSLVAAGAEQCPSCGTAVAADQRYCLHCGQRCGEPRLPFMNAVTFMDAMKQPKTAAAPTAKPKRRGVSANAALIAGVGTLILAMGVGVLIGRSGENSSVATPAAAQIIKVPAGGGTESVTASTGKAGGGSGGGAKSAGSKKPDKAALKKEAESQKGAEEVLKPAAGVDLPPATVKPGSSCPSGTAGCKGGEFTGEYFGE